jgi:putative transposase
MPNYRRNDVAGSVYFFTPATLDRSPLLTTDLGRTSLRNAIHTVQKNYPFELFATVLLPDHWHSVWILPEGDDRSPLRWRRIKEEFTRAWLEGGRSRAGPVRITATAPAARRVAETLLGAHRP